MPDQPHSTTPDRSAVGRRAMAALLVLLVVLVGPSVGHPVGVQDEDDEAAPITWGIRPSTAEGPDGRDAFELTLDPGETVEDHIGVSNFTTGPLELAVYATDAFIGPHGHFDLLPAAEGPTDVGSWVAFATETVTVPPRSRLDIPFRLTVPDRATPGDHTGGIVASLTSTTTDPDGTPLTVDRRVGARIYLRVSGDLEPTATITDVTASYDGTGNPVSRGAATVTYTVTNTGNVRLAGTPTVEIAGPFGLGRTTVAGPELPELLPGNELTFTVPISSVAPLGRLTATVDLTPRPLGVDDITAATVAGRATTWAIPWPQLAALALLALFGRRLLTARSSRGGGHGPASSRRNASAAASEPGSAARALR